MTAPPSCKQCGRTEDDGIRCRSCIAVDLAPSNPENGHAANPVSKGSSFGASDG